MKRLRPFSPFLFLFLVLMLVLPVDSPQAAQRMLRGDWQSAGAPMPPPRDPNFSYTYDCQAELTDEVSRKGNGVDVPKGVPYRLYAMARMQLTKDVTYLGLDKANWIWIARLEHADPSENEVLLPNAPVEAFSTEGHSIGLRLHAAYPPGAMESLSLSATVQLPLGPYNLTESQQRNTTRADESVYTRARASVWRAPSAPESLPESLVRELFVVCDKKQ